jgi:hypothetical protein
MKQMSDSGLTEEIIISQGYQPLSSIELKNRIFNKTINGDYYIGRIFAIYIDTDGKMEGINDLGSHRFGQCFIDFENNTLTTKWIMGWDNWTGRAYLVNNEIQFFDTTTNMWRTTFNKIEEGFTSLKII